MRGPGEAEMEAGKSVYQVTAQFSLKNNVPTYDTPGSRSWSKSKILA